MNEFVVEIGTPKGLYTETFPKTAKIEEIIAAAVQAMDLDGGEPLDLVHNGQVLEPNNRPINSFELICKIEMELVATGAGV